MIARLLVATALLATPVMAQDHSDPNAPPKRIRSVVLFGNDTCPKSTDPDEIVVCANGGDSPYRIPKRFRDKPKDDAGSQSWVNRVETVQEINNNLLPTGCTTIGPGSYSGCSRNVMRDWAQERLNKRVQDAEATTPADDN